MGQIYDGMANPKEKGTGKELPKPADYETLITSAEAAYQKGIDLNSPNKEYQYNLIFNLGALYNNYGGYYQNRQPATITEMAKVQKENDAKSQEAFKKAIPLLERALTIKPDDRPTMIALRKLYMFTKQDDKAKEMNEKLKK
jgi:tetratricopeptide (TPR) repeat protein